MESHFELVKLEPRTEVTSIDIKEECQQVKEEPSVPTVNVKTKDDVTEDEYILGLGDKPDETQNLSSVESQRDPVNCSSAKAPGPSILCDQQIEGCNLGTSRIVSETDLPTHKNYSEMKKIVSLQHFANSHAALSVPDCCIPSSGGHLLKDHRRLGALPLSHETHDTCRLEIRSVKKDMKCEICGKYCKTTSHLKKHLRIHSGRKDYKCEVCGKCFNETAHLKRHLRVHSGEKDCKCDVCGKCFTEPCTLKRHLIIHSGRKDCKCKECGKCFTDTWTLKRHLRFHAGIRNYKCEECGKFFSQTSDLQKHVKIHTGKKDYKCGICGNCFTLRSTLNNHVRIHSGIKDYKCEECGKCFSRGSNLKRHLIIHTHIKNC